MREAGRMLRQKLATVAELNSALTDAFAAGALGVLAAVVRIGVDDVDVAEQDPEPVEAKGVEHQTAFPSGIPF